MRSLLVPVLLLTLAITACTAEATPAGPGSADPASTPSGTAGADEAAAEAAAAETAEFEADLRRTLTLPPVPAFTIPTQLLTTAENQRISGELDVPPGLYEGIAVLDARCTDAGDASAADSGTPVTGATQHFEDETTSITVAADGTGNYEAPDVHVAVLPDGAGVYDDGETRVSVAADGSGTYKSGDARYSVRADGSGSYEDDTTRVWIDGTGAGGYEDGSMRLSMNAAGELFGDGDADRVAVVQSVLTDGLPLFPPVPAVTVVEPSGTVCGTVIRLDSNVVFDFDSVNIQPNGQEHLQRVAALLDALGSPHAQITGHTDSVGDDAYNLDLSDRRAGAVRDLLIESGVSADSLDARGLGEAEPLRAETGPDGAPDPAAQQLNRRVEILLLD
ncbi:OmpA family protein [Planctomonas psychrotolerans]|uniref:OmpA family protein n=1 Tax=Planctomonas psychrotolerans TaxID=2528712 RepID=UPI00123C317B|nr:OmpA family protein [Planctomonas psychrotolerans]